MSRCVPSWDNIEDHTRILSHKPPSNTIMSSNHDVPTLDYEVAELTWKNGQVAMHGLGPPRMVTKYAWDKPRAAETLETIVNQATNYCKPHNDLCSTQEVVPWLSSAIAAGGSVSASPNMTMDALVPNSGTQPDQALISGRTDGSTRVGSCSSEKSGFGDHMVAQGGGGVVAAVAHEWSSCRDQSVSEGSRQLTVVPLG